jgi:hypothetical protein
VCHLLMLIHYLMVDQNVSRLVCHLLMLIHYLTVDQNVRVKGEHCF